MRHTVTIDNVTLTREQVERAYKALNAPDIRRGHWLEGRCGNSYLVLYWEPGNYQLIRKDGYIFSGTPPENFTLYDPQPSLVIPPQKRS